MTRDDEPEGERDLEVAGAGIGPGSHDRSAADEDERERPDELGERRAVPPEACGERPEAVETGAIGRGSLRSFWETASN